ncbi:hypothetical protein B0H14DRAFT_3906397 [Mycena olivaceomarginata]|nr:hypothetical protein B0H14DRAFT_3906397 [Mycena olivaceomarginata]
MSRLGYAPSSASVLRAGAPASITPDSSLAHSRVDGDNPSPPIPSLSPSLLAPFPFPPAARTSPPNQPSSFPASLNLTGYEGDGASLSDAPVRATWLPFLPRSLSLPRPHPHNDDDHTRRFHTAFLKRDAVHRVPGASVESRDFPSSAAALCDDFSFLWCLSVYLSLTSRGVATARPPIVPVPSLGWRFEIVCIPEASRRAQVNGLCIGSLLLPRRNSGREVAISTQIFPAFRAYCVAPDDYVYQKGLRGRTRHPGPTAQSFRSLIISERSYMPKLTPPVLSLPSKEAGK